MSRCLIITPDLDDPIFGTDRDPATVAREHIGESLDVVRCRSIDWRFYVLYIDDWGAVNGLPVNRRAWALYGGSPIHGTAVLAADDQGLIEEGLVDLIVGDLLRDEVMAAMDDFLRDNP